MVKLLQHRKLCCDLMHINYFSGEKTDITRETHWLTREFHC